MARGKRNCKDTVSDATLTASTSHDANQTTEKPPDDVAARPPQKKQKHGKSAVIQPNQAAIPLQDSSAFGVLCADVLIEIFSYLKPLDLLHLSWTGKYLHHLMTSKSMKLVWKNARQKNVMEGIPDCPSWMTEHLYANLMFSDHCFYCLKHYIPYEMRANWIGCFRTCIHCLENQNLFFPVPVRSEDYYELQKREKEWYSGYSTPVLAICHPRILYDDKTYYSVDVLKKWKAEYDRSKDQYKWGETKLSIYHVSASHSQESKDWLHGYTYFLQNEHKEIILEHAKKIGWQEELLYEDTPKAVDVLVSESAIKKACAKRSLSQTDLAALEPTINGVMQTIRDVRTASDRKKALTRRIPILSEAVKLCRAKLPPNAIVPDIADVFQVPSVLDIITSKPRELDFTIHNLDPLVEAYPDISREWRVKTEAKLVEMIRSAAGESYSFNPDTVLRLATTIFSCGRSPCWNSPHKLWYPRVLIHHHHTTGSPVMYQSNSDLGLLYRLTRVAPWNCSRKIDFLNTERIILSNVLKQFGFDPDTVTAEEMDTLDPIFECVSCSNPRKGRFTMKWTFLAPHLKSEHANMESGKPPQHIIEMFHGETAQSIRDRFAEENAPDRLVSLSSRHDPDDWQSQVCAHCKWTNTPAVVADHLWEEHGVANPTDADMVPNLDVPPAYNHRYSWPPRKVERKPELPVEGVAGSAID